MSLLFDSRSALSPLASCWNSDRIGSSLYKSICQQVSNSNLDCVRRTAVVAMFNGERGGGGLMEEVLVLTLSTMCHHRGGVPNFGWSYLHNYVCHSTS